MVERPSRFFSSLKGNSTNIKDKEIRSVQADIRLAGKKVSKRNI